MSGFTDFLNNSFSEGSWLDNGVKLYTDIVKTNYNLQQGYNAMPTRYDIAAANAAANTNAGGALIQTGGIGIGTLAIVGIGAYLIFKKRK